MTSRARGTASCRLALLAAAGVLLPAATAVAMSTAATTSTSPATGPLAAAPGAAAAVTGSVADTAGAAGAATTAGSASSTTTTSGTGTSRAAEGESPVIFGPLLGFFKFGAGVGAPLVCQAATSGMGSGAGEIGVAEQAAPVIQAINDGCDTMSTNGVMFVEMGQEQSAPAAALNPFVNPVIESAATGIENFGRDYHDTVSPFGSTIEGSGNTVRWLEGK